MKFVKLGKSGKDGVPEVIPLGRISLGNGKSVRQVYKKEMQSVILLIYIYPYLILYII